MHKHKQIAQHFTDLEYRIWKKLWEEVPAFESVVTKLESNLYVLTHNLKDELTNV